MTDFRIYYFPVVRLCRTFFFETAELLRSFIPHVDSLSSSSYPIPLATACIGITCATSVAFAAVFATFGSIAAPIVHDVTNNDSDTIKTSGKNADCRHSHQQLFIGGATERRRYEAFSAWCCWMSRCVASAAFGSSRPAQRSALPSG